MKRKMVSALSIAACLLLTMFASITAFAAPDASTGLEYTTGSTLGTIWAADIGGRQYSGSWGQLTEKSWDDPVVDSDGNEISGNGALIRKKIVTNDDNNNLVIDTGDLAGNMLQQNFWANESTNQQKVFQAYCEANSADLTMDGKAIKFTIQGNYADNEFTQNHMFFINGTIEIPGLPGFDYGRDFRPDKEPDVDLDKRIYISNEVPAEDIVSYNDIVVKQNEQEYTIIQKLTYPKGQAQTVIVEFIMPDGFTLQTDGTGTKAGISWKSNYISCNWGTPVAVKATVSPFTVVDVEASQPGSNTETAPDTESTETESVTETETITETASITQTQTESVTETQTASATTQTETGITTQDTTATPSIDMDTSVTTTFPYASTDPGDASTPYTGAAAIPASALLLIAAASIVLLKSKK